MTAGYSTLDVLRGASLVAVALLTLLLLLMLRAPGYRTSRLVLFAVVALVGWVGAAGAMYDRADLLLAGAVGQFLLGFWNFTIGLFMLPTAAILLANAVVLEKNQTSE